MTLPNPPFQTGIQDVSTDRVRPTWQQWIIRLLNQVNGLTGTTTNPVAGDGTGGFREITLGDGLSFVDGVLSASSNAAVYGQFFDDTTQTLAVANVSQLVRINSNSIEQGCFLQSSGRVVFEQYGTFNVQYSIQLANSSSQLHDAVVWFAKNAESIPASSTMVTVPNKHGGTNGHNCLVCNLFITVAAGDFVELYWSGQDTALSLETVPELTIDTMPASPSVILTVTPA
jgi:hypothetical protein